MDKRELVMMMLDYEELIKKATLLKREIRAEVMVRKETVGAGNVEAKYSPGRKSYQYEEAVKLAEIDRFEKKAAITDNTKTKVKEYTSWSKVIKQLGIEKEDVPFTQSDPSVRIKVS